MSGRSAYVRAKNNRQHTGTTQGTSQFAGRQTSFRNYTDFATDEPFLYAYTGPAQQAGISRSSQQTSSPNSSFVANSATAARRRSHSSAGSSYGYPNAPHLHKPRPIVIASAIEKSDFRTHLDGMSSTLRGKLGGFMKSNKKETMPLADRSRNRPQTTESEFDFNVENSDAPVPSLAALPSLTTNSTAPSENQLSGNMQTSYSVPTRSRQAVQQEAFIHKIRRFEGGGKLPQLGWKSLSNNPELWDEHGDTFVYMYMKGSRTKPPPSFRIDSQVIFESSSSYFIDKLCNIQEPPGWPEFVPHEDDDMDTDEEGDNYTVSFDGVHSSTSFHDNVSESEVASRPSKRARQQQQAPSKAARAPPGVQYELYIPWPGTDTGIHSTIWHITTRNHFAVMYNASSLVGITLLEALTKLFDRIKNKPEYLDPNVDKVAWITNYIVGQRFDDVHNNPSYAASLLAFSELPEIRWREGYIEAFVHCVGMLDLGLQTIPEWRSITPHTKMFLENANLEIEERIHRAQGYLTTFDFTEMWPITLSTQSQARGCFDRLRKWLCKYYENAFLHWPPTSEMTWLTRDLVVRLANDFHGLYDYLVDRDLTFQGPENRPGQRWTITSRSGQNFRADSYDLPLTDILVAFDKNNGFPHIPHPYPITPPSAPTLSKPKSTFTLKKPPTVATGHLAQSRRKALSYAEATNVYTLRDQYMHTDLVTNFIRFEQSDNIETVDPYEARRGRWLLIYGILQALATVSVDSPNLRYKDGAQYHLCPQMKGVVPWAERGAPPEEEAEHTRSYCWIVPQTWGANDTGTARPRAHEPTVSDNFGDGLFVDTNNADGVAQDEQDLQSGDHMVLVDPSTTTATMRQQTSASNNPATPSTARLGVRLNNKFLSGKKSSSELSTAGSAVGGASSRRINEIEAWVKNTPVTGPSSTAGGSTSHIGLASTVDLSSVADDGLDDASMAASITSASNLRQRQARAQAQTQQYVHSPTDRRRRIPTESSQLTGLSRKEREKEKATRNALAGGIVATTTTTTTVADRDESGLGDPTSSPMKVNAIVFSGTGTDAPSSHQRSPSGATAASTSARSRGFLAHIHHSANDSDAASLHTTTDSVHDPSPPPLPSVHLGRMGSPITGTATLVSVSSPHRSRKEVKGGGVSPVLGSGTTSGYAAPSEW